MQDVELENRELKEELKSLHMRFQSLAKQVDSQVQQQPRSQEPQDGTKMKAASIRHDIEKLQRDIDFLRKPNETFDHHMTTDGYQDQSWNAPTNYRSTNGSVNVNSFMDHNKIQNDNSRKSQEWFYTTDHRDNPLNQPFYGGIQEVRVAPAKNLSANPKSPYRVDQFTSHLQHESKSVQRKPVGLSDTLNQARSSRLQSSRNSVGKLRDISNTPTRPTKVTKSQPAKALKLGLPKAKTPTQIRNAKSQPVAKIRHSPVIRRG